MGCDIHATIEYAPSPERQKERSGSLQWWSFAADVEINRDYYLFSLLAGVRGRVEPVISDDRGVPDDASFEFGGLYDYWDADAHTPGYATFAELKNWQPMDATAKPLWSDFRTDDFYKVMELLANKYGEEYVRLVFFFDN